MPPINDSSEVRLWPEYPCPFSAKILGIRGDTQPTKSTRFVDSHPAPSGHALMRGRRLPASYVFLDAGAGVAWPYHSHAGKLGFHYWHGGRPYLVDSGVCNYDEALRTTWYLSAPAHNTILVDGLGDA